jgi:hypothetical protein
MSNIILSILEETHNRLWEMGINVSSQTSRAQRLTREWQDRLVSADPARCKAEFIAGSSSRYKIDLVDLKARTAYELKVSKNNPHFEFYKDVFKVLYANKPEKILDKLVFCCPAESKSKLGALGMFVSTLSKQIDLEVEIHYIKNSNGNKKF